MRIRFLVPILLILLVNIFVLSGVWYNRHMGDEHQLVLTERELSFPYSWHAGGENSGVSLQIKWRIFEPGKLYQAGFPVSQAELERLGFNAESYLNRYQVTKYFPRSRQEKVLYWALQLNGSAYQDHLNWLQQQVYAGSLDESRAERMSEDGSRLYLVDIESDLSKLHERWTQDNVVFVKGNTRFLRRESDEQEGVFSWVLVPEGLLVSKLHVPKHLHSFLDTDTLQPQSSLFAQADDRLPFQATVQWGKRLEPWIVDIQRTQVED